MLCILEDSQRIRLDEIPIIEYAVIPDRINISHKWISYTTVTGKSETQIVYTHVAGIDPESIYQLFVIHTRLRRCAVFDNRIGRYNRIGRCNRIGTSFLTGFRHKKCQHEYA